MASSPAQHPPAPNLLRPSGTHTAGCFLGWNSLLQLPSPAGLTSRVLAPQDKLPCALRH